MRPYKVLDIYYPSILPADKWNSSAGWRCWKIGEDLCELTASLGYIPFNDPKHPAQPWANWVDQSLHSECKRQTPEYRGAEDWHKDGDTTQGARMDCSIILWSSATPTEFDYKGKIYQPEPFEVVIFNNLECSHRRPLNAPKQRFIFRQRVEQQ